MAYDFSGWATRNDLKCSDGRTIRKDAFKDQDGEVVPLVWNHNHNDAMNVLGHALLKNRPEGVYAYCSFNDTEQGENARLLVKHGDIKSLSIYANKLKQQGGNVLHGAIREVSLVLAGANPGAYIDNILAHGEDGSDYELEDEAIIFTGEDVVLSHADDETEKPNEKPEEKEKPEMAEGKEKTVKDVFDTLTEEQKTVVYALIGQAIEDAKGGNNDSDEEDDDVKHNVFDTETNTQDYISHADQGMIISDMKRFGSLSESFKNYADNYLTHADGDDETQTYGLVGMEDVLFPDAKSVTPTPDFIKRDDGWVNKVINGAKHTPFSRIKSAYADITEDDARARGYLKKGTYKKEEVFPLFKRTTSPTTIYKKQKLDRDDIIDITDFDVVSWLKAEMRMMLNEEIARAVLVGDGRDPSSDDKINELNIRPIYKDTEKQLYAFNVIVEHAAGASDDTKAKAAIRAIVKARKEYKGTGTPTLFCTEDLLTDMLLLEDGIGHALYGTVDVLATKLRVKEIVTVPVMEGISREAGGKTYNLAGIVVNMADYTIGADKGGNVNFFDDFDIDYNQQKYLMETRCSGALVHPKSAMIIEFNEVAAG